MVQGIKTRFHSDVKMPVFAGMQFTYPDTKNNKISKIGHDVFRHYYDSKEKDCQVGSERIKRVLNKAK